jgi:hypothetical protein
MRTSGPTSPGRLLRAGLGFTPAGVTVTFGANNAEVTPPVTANTVKVKAPQGAVGDVEVVVTNSNGNKSKPAKYKYT